MVGGLGFDSQWHFFSLMLIYHQLVAVLITSDQNHVHCKCVGVHIYFDVLNSHLDM